MVRLSVTDKKIVSPVFLIVSFVVVIAVVIVLYLFWGLGREGVGIISGTVNEESVLPNQANTSEKRSYQIELSGGNPEIIAIAENVSKHIALPGGRVVVATVVSANELRKANPIFYQYASDGDKVLIYDDRAVLYSPEIDRVLDVVHFAPADATQ